MDIKDIAYINDWHTYVKQEPDKHCQDIKQLKAMIEQLFERDDIYYDPADVEDFIDFARLFKHREGRFAGQSFELSMEQKYIVACVFGIKTYDEELKMNVRYFTELILLVARKWGKSFFISSILLYLSLMDGEGSPQIWCLASIKSQAAIVYDNCKKMLLSSPELTPEDDKEKYWYSRRDRDGSEMILFPLNDGKLKPAGKNSANQDGLNSAP